MMFFDLLDIITNIMWLLFLIIVREPAIINLILLRSITDCYFLVVNNQKKSFYMNVYHYCYAENTA